ncbi:MAG: RluA family pseudouridine synthase [Dehalococcoidia bacterium]|nr:RluA family pseudouridine synthase [Dehalococcoidia bacterium]RLC62315.1 MAG: RluA family pseudouridine synthase [Chloroflexota bacterium]
MNTSARPEIRTFQFSSSAPDIRLDKYLTLVLPQFSRAHLQKLIEQGYILVNGKRAKSNQRLSKVDKITVELPPLVVRPLAESIPLTIIYEDEDLLVIDKPAGLIVHPAPGHPNHTLVNAVLAHCPNLATSNEQMRPGIVHRLDKDTSGLIVIAKNDFAREYLAAQFKSRTVTKGYLVLVKGKLSPEQGVIEAPIGRDPRSRWRMAIVEAGKEASTQYRVRKYLDNYTLVEVTPLTGRTHQIRVHLSAIGYPVVGDPIYGIKSAHPSRQFIHAYRLGFRLPSTEQYQEFTSPLPLDLERTLEYLSRS